MFEFEYFNPNLGSVTVSIAEYGLTFSKASVETLGRPEYVKLAYDKHKDVIGVIPTQEMDSRKIEFISKEKNGYVRINTKDFVRFLMKYHQDKIEMFSNKAIRYFSYWDDENKFLIVDLKRPLDINAKETNEIEKNKNDGDEI